MSMTWERIFQRGKNIAAAVLIDTFGNPLGVASNPLTVNTVGPPPIAGTVGIDQVTANANEVVVKSGTVTADTELPAAAALNGTIAKSVSAPVVGAGLLINDGTNLILVKAGAQGGLVIEGVASGTAVPVSGSVTADTELPAAAALNGTIAKSVSAPVVGAALLVSDNTNFIQPLGDAANGLDVDVTRMAALVAGTANIGKVDPNTATPTPYNVTCTVADTEYSQALPGNCRGFEFQARTEATLRFAFVTGKVAGSVAPYLTLKAGDYYYSPSLNQGASPSTLFVACSTAGVVVEVLCWV